MFSKAKGGNTQAKCLGLGFRVKYRCLTKLKQNLQARIKLIFISRMMCKELFYCTKCLFKKRSQLFFKKSNMEVGTLKNHNNKLKTDKKQTITTNKDKRGKKNN
jgi:hypothetical protein